MMGIINGYAKQPAIQLGKNNLKNSQLLSNVWKVVQMASVLLSAHAACINMNSSRVSRVTTECTVKTQCRISRLLWTTWDSFDHLLSSNLWANNCHWHRVMTHFIDIIHWPFEEHLHYSGVSKSVTPFSVPSSRLLMNAHTPWTFSLLIEFLPFTRLWTLPWWKQWSNPPTRGELTLGCLRFPR